MILGDRAQAGKLPRNVTSIKKLQRKGIGAPAISVCGLLEGVEEVSSVLVLSGRLGQVSG